MLIAALAIVGCGSTCDRDAESAPTRFEGGQTDLAAGVYETSPFQGPYLDFPGGRTYRLVHGLGGRPRVVDTYLAFEENPSSTAPGAGNQVTIEAVTAEFIDVRNDTCSDVFLRVVASAPVTP